LGLVPKRADVTSRLMVSDTILFVAKIGPSSKNRHSM
jgi:hypothetical protein